MPINYIDCGAFVLLLKCPRCGVGQECYITLTARLTVDVEAAALSAKLHTKSVDHRCAGGGYTVTPPAEVVDEVGTPAFDFRDLAAGAHLDQ